MSGVCGEALATLVAAGEGGGGGGGGGVPTGCRILLQ